MPQAGSNIGVPPLTLLKDMSGLEFLRRIVDGRLPRPPITETLGFDLAEVSPGFALFTMTPQFRHYNPIGTVHGGVAATLLDSCMSCAVQKTIEAGLGYTTLKIKVNMVRPITEKTGPIRAEGRSLHTGRRSATAEGKILDATGTLLAHGTTTCIVFPL
ncbi:MAG: PaaI family thioesterase [Alphaproteobacteria bacterium]|nr:MAG: PaaI family thioesterase [Alphaproteobacteria bacterium]